MIDNKPQEFIYLCLNEFNLKYNTSKFKVPDTKDMTEERVEFMMDIGHIQIDNLINEEMPVLLGAKSFYDRDVLVASQVSKESRMRESLAMAYRMVEDGDLKPPELDKNGNVLPRLPFMRANFMMS